MIHVAEYRQTRKHCDMLLPSSVLHPFPIPFPTYFPPSYSFFLSQLLQFSHTSVYSLGLPLRFLSVLFKDTNSASCISRVSHCLRCDFRGSGEKNTPVLHSSTPKNFSQTVYDDEHCFNLFNKDILIIYM